VPTSRTWSDEAFIHAVADSLSVADVLRRLGLRVAGANYAAVYAAVRRLQLDVSHWRGRGWRRDRSTPGAPRQPLSAILVRGSSYRSRRSLKRRLLAGHLLEYRCAVCGIAEWRGARLALELDHRNGDDEDNELSNLRLLCPNCHSQTPTYRGRNIGRRRITNETRPGGETRLDA
jgi:5-methylcytosine-specific restriction endonuclease McrA